MLTSLKLFSLQSSFTFTSSASDSNEITPVTDQKAFNPLHVIEAGSDDLKST